MEIGLDAENNEARIYMSYQQKDGENSDGNNSNNETPLPSRGPPSRIGGQVIDID